MSSFSYSLVGFVGGVVVQKSLEFQEQIQWAVQHGADYIIAERFEEFGEAKLALDCIKEFGNGRKIKLREDSFFIAIISNEIHLTVSLFSHFYFGKCFLHQSIPK